MRTIGEKAAARCIDAAKKRGEGLTYKEIGASLVNAKTGNRGVSATMARALAIKGKKIIEGEISIGRATALRGALNVVCSYLSFNKNIYINKMDVIMQKEIVRKLLSENTDDDLLKIKNMGQARLRALRDWAHNDESGLSGECNRNDDK
jgi:hypothetical protein